MKRLLITLLAIGMLAIGASEAYAGCNVGFRQVAFGVHRVAFVNTVALQPVELPVIAVPQINVSAGDPFVSDSVFVQPVFTSAFASPVFGVDTVVVRRGFGFARSRVAVVAVRAPRLGVFRGGLGSRLQQRIAFNRGVREGARDAAFNAGARVGLGLGRRR